MSSANVRKAVIADWMRLAPGLPFCDTINGSLPKTLPERWGSLSFNVTSRRHVTMGANPWIEEQGTIMFAVAIPSGSGHIAGTEKADEVMRACEGWTDATGDIEFLSVGAPQPIELEAEGDWYLLGVPVNYRAQERAQLP